MATKTKTRVAVKTGNALVCQFQIGRTICGHDVNCGGVIHGKIYCQTHFRQLSETWQIRHELQRKAEHLIILPAIVKG